MGNWASLQSILWFLPALLSLNLIVYVYMKSTMYLKYFIVLLSILSFLLSTYIVKYHNVIPFGLDVAIYLFNLVLIIKIIYDNKIYDKLDYAKIFILIFISSSLLFYYEPIKIHSQYHSIIDFAQFSVANTFIGYFSFIAVNSSIFILFMKLKSNNTLSTIGIYSLPIYLLYLIILYKCLTKINDIKVGLKVAV